MLHSRIPQCIILWQKCARVCTFLLQNGALWDICLMNYGIRAMLLLMIARLWQFLLFPEDFIFFNFCHTGTLIVGQLICPGPCKPYFIYLIYNWYTGATLPWLWTLLIITKLGWTLLLLWDLDFAPWSEFPTNSLSILQIVFSFLAFFLFNNKKYCILCIVQ